jgi:PDZ domain-containing protein
MKTDKLSYWLLLPALFSALAWPVVALSAPPKGAPPKTAPQAQAQAEESEEIPPGQRLGAPQVLEIAPAPAPEPKEVESVAAPAPTPTPPPTRAAEYTEPPITEKTVGRETADKDIQPLSNSTAKTKGSRNYLGVLYATAEEGPVGVKVLDVVPGSPAERAGFSGTNRPSEGQSTLVKAAIVVLAMSPAGPFAIPLAIAHDMYMNRQTPGDLIVAVNNQPVHNAQEFSEVMRHYQPRETVTFSVLRGGKATQISVQLEEEPS